MIDPEEFNKKYFRKKDSGKYQYYIPELDRWVSSTHLNRVLISELNMTSKEWYDSHFLPKDDNGNIIPKICDLDGCNNEAHWRGVGLYAYGKYCCTEHSYLGKGKNISKSLELSKERRSSRMKELRSDKSSKYNTKEYRENTRTRFKDMWRDPNSRVNSIEYKIKQSESQRRTHNTPEMRKLHSDKAKECATIEKRRRNSEASKKLWKDSSYLNKQRNSGNYYINEYNFNSTSIVSKNLFSDIKKIIKILSEEEYIVRTGEMVLDSHSFRKLDFYIPSLNKWIEFNGDYWHRNPKNAILFSSDPIKAAEIWVKDKDRIKAVSKVLGTKPLIIWESDYRSDPEGTVSRCLDFILDREGGSLCQQN